MPSTRKKPLAGRCAFRQEGDCTCLSLLWIDPAWRRRGYGSYLLRQVLHRLGGYAADTASLFCRAAAAGGGGGGLSGPSSAFGPRRDGWCAGAKPDLTAVRLAQEFLAARPAKPPAVGGRHLRQWRGYRLFVPPGRGGRAGARLRYPARGPEGHRRPPGNGRGSRPGAAGWCWTATQTFCTTSSPVPSTG